MGKHSGSHHSSSRSHSGSHHRSSRSHRGSHHSSSGSGSHSFSRTKTSTYKYRAAKHRYYSEDSIPESAVRHGGTWYHKESEQFGIDMDDPYVEEHYDERKTSWFYRQTNKSPIAIIIIFYIFFFSAAFVFGVASSNVFYESLIPIFENADMTDLAFFIADNTIYYVQYVLAFGYTASVPVLTIRKCIKSKEYDLGFVKQMLIYYNKLDEDYAVKYLDECPGCGAITNKNHSGPIRYCEYCGRSLRADDYCENR